MELKDGGLISTPVGTTFYIAPELLSGQRIGPTDVRKMNKTKFISQSLFFRKLISIVWV
jgi:serine/threonine protein kinase